MKSQFNLRRSHRFCRQSTTLQYRPKQRCVFTASLGLPSGVGDCRNNFTWCTHSQTQCITKRTSGKETVDSQK